MNKESISLIIIGLIIFLGLVMHFFNFNNPSEIPTVCPSDLKLCDDGSYVGRTVPNCNFIECGQNADTTRTNAEEKVGTTSPQQ